jgi:hypothetical protein
MLALITVPSVFVLSSRKNVHVLDASGWVDEGVGDVLDVHCYPGPLCGDPAIADSDRQVCRTDKVCVGF